MTYNKLSQDYTLRIQGNAYSASNSDAVTNQTSVNNIWKNMEVSEAQEGAQPPKSQGKSYLLELFKKGISEKELKNVAKSFAQTISDVSIDKEGNLIISETPNEYGVFEETKYNKKGEIQEQQKKCNWRGQTYAFELGPHGYIGPVFLKKDNISYEFDNMEKFKNKQYTRNKIISEDGSLISMKFPTYRENGTLESEIKYDIKDGYNGGFYFDKNEKDSIDYYAIPNEDKALYIKTYDPSEGTARGYEYDEDGNVRRVIEYENQPPYKILDGEVFILDGKVHYEGNSKNPDGHIGTATQSSGDDYFHAALNAITQFDQGNKLLNNLIKYTSDGGAEITFPGTSKLKGNWQSSYKITKQELEDIKANKKRNLSEGDFEVKLLEYGFGKLLKDWNKNFGTNLKLGSSFESNKVIQLLLGDKADSIFYSPSPVDINKGKQSLAYCQDNKSKVVISSDYSNLKFPSVGETLDNIKKDPKYSTPIMKRKIEALELIKKSKKSFTNNLVGNISFLSDDGKTHLVTLKEIRNNSVILLDSSKDTLIEMSFDYLLDIAKDITLINQPKVDLMDYDVTEVITGGVPKNATQKITNAPSADLPKDFKLGNK